MDLPLAVTIKRDIVLCFGPMPFAFLLVSINNFLSLSLTCLFLAINLSLQMFSHDCN